MTATLADFVSILLEDYADAVAYQLSDEVEILSFVEKGTRMWEGRKYVIPVHVTRNSGTGFISETGSLPAAGQQGYTALEVTAKYLVGRFAVTAPAMAAAKKGGKRAVIDWGESEMDRLVDDVRQRADRAAVSGGRLAGFINEHKKTTGVGTTAWQFSGDFDKLSAALTAKGGNILVKLIRLDTGNALAYSSTQGAASVELSAVDKGAGTVTLSNTDSAAADVDTSGVTAGYGIGLYISDTDPSLDYLDSEPVGVYGALGLPTYHGVARDMTASGYEALHAIVLTQSTTSTHARADMTLARLERLLAEVMNKSGADPDLIWMNHFQRQRFVAICTDQISVDPKGSAGKADPGFTGFSYGGRPIRNSKHVDNGLILALSTKTWEFCELEEGGFADDDGNVLSRVSGTMSFEGYYRWFFNLACQKPGANGALVGVSL